MLSCDILQSQQLKYVCVNEEQFVDIPNITEGETKRKTKEGYLHKKGKSLYLFADSVLLLIKYDNGGSTET